MAARVAPGRWPENIPRPRRDTPRARGRQFAIANRLGGTRQRIDCAEALTSRGQLGGRDFLVERLDIASESELLPIEIGDGGPTAIDPPA